jgi:hypothetical protein
MIYLLVLFLLLIPVLWYDVLKKSKGIEFWYFLDLLVLILLTGLRYRVGGDTLAYIEFFDEYPTLIELFNFDFIGAQFGPLWYISNALIKSIWNDFVFFQIIHATFVNIVFFWFFRKYLKRFFTAIVLYYIGFYFYFNMEILREIISICIFMLGFGCLLEKKYLKYYTFSIVALLFHYSAMLMLFIPFLFLIKDISWKKTLIVALSLFAILSLFDISPLLIKLLFGNEQLNLKFDSYTSLDDKANFVGLLTTIFPIVLLMHTNKEINCEKANLKINNLMFLYVQLTIFTAFFPAMFNRMTNYLVPFYLILIVVSIEIFNFKVDKYFLSKRALIARFVLIMFVFFKIYSFTKDTSDVMLGTKYYNIFYPYYTVFNPVVDVKRERFVDLYKEE